jgi:hypothetical protein
MIHKMMLGKKDSDTKIGGKFSAEWVAALKMTTKKFEYLYNDLNLKN